MSDIEIGITTKTCRDCGVEKSSTDFAPRGKGRVGLRSETRTNQEPPYARAREGLTRKHLLNRDGSSQAPTSAAHGGRQFIRHALFLSGPWWAPQFLLDQVQPFSKVLFPGSSLARARVGRFRIRR